MCFLLLLLRQVLLAAIAADEYGQLASHFFMADLGWLGGFVRHPDLELRPGSPLRDNRALPWIIMLPVYLLLMKRDLL